jgi:homoserine acetyltransferase
MADYGRNCVGIVETKTVRLVGPEDPLKLASGRTLAPIDVAYETYGTLSPVKLAPNLFAEQAIYVTSKD